jgi:hypothetical protein
MKALVIYESMYGNTAAVAEAIGHGLEERAFETGVTPLDHVGTDLAVDLLVVGGPTHAHGMSRASTRAGAVKDEKNTFDAPTTGDGLREWLGELPAGEGRAAAFDTRFDKPVILVGSAARGIGKGLQRRGRRLVAEPESFFVTKANRLEPEEQERARQWGATLAKAHESSRASR